MQPNDEVLKVDSRGRVWTPRERRDALLAEFERSGMPGTKFAAHVGIKYSTFAQWRKRQRRTQSASVAPAGSGVRWVEAVAPTAHALCVHLPGGGRVEIGDLGQARLAAELLRALAGENSGPSCR